MSSPYLRTDGRRGARLKAGCIPLVEGVEGHQRGTRATKRPSGTIWPNGEFGLGYAPLVEAHSAIEENPAGFGSPEALRSAVGRLVSRGAPPLDLTSLPNSHKPVNRPETYGRRGLSGYGGKMIRNAGYLLQRRHGKRCLSFLTLTLPEMTKEEAQRVARAWPELIRKLLQHLSRLLERRGLSSAIASVTEIQPARFADGGCSVLHLHAVFQGRKKGKAWALTPNEIRAWWLKNLSKIAGMELRSGAACDMKAISKDAGNYLSKYMSKGVGLIEEYAERMGWECVPRQWWNMTAPARDMVRRGCLRGLASMELLDTWVYSFYHSECQELFKFCRAIEVQATEKQSFVVGFWGKLSSSGLRELNDLTGVVKSD